MKMRLSQTMGVESPSPGMGVFHLTLLVSLQVTGGSASGATPVASGPRHCGQKRSAAESARSRPGQSGHASSGRKSKDWNLASNRERSEVFIMSKKYSGRL